MRGRRKRAMLGPAGGQRQAQACPQAAACPLRDGYIPVMSAGKRAGDGRPEAATPGLRATRRI